MGHRLHVCPDLVTVYVAFVLDVFAQRIVGWHASSSMRTDLVMTPLRIALWQRDREGNPVSPGDLIHHSDAGSQYTSIRYTEHLDLKGIAPSIGTVGDAYDNALMESVNGLYQTECIRTTVFHPGPFRTLADVEFATAGWVDWYNNRRLHGSLGMLTPIEFETLHYEALTREPAPTKSAAENPGRFSRPCTPAHRSAGRCLSRSHAFAAANHGQQPAVGRRRCRGGCGVGQAQPGPDGTAQRLPPA